MLKIYEASFEEFPERLQGLCVANGENGDCKLSLSRIEFGRVVGARMRCGNY
jgi:hypothetical protein